jgi:adenylate cyclase, class 2
MNGQETEVKFYVRDLQKIEMRLHDLKAQLIQPRTHESNIRFDKANGELRKSNRILRLRQDDKSRFTFKGPNTEKEGVVSRQEIEFAVDNFESAKQFLEALDFEEIVYYEKYRITYELNDMHIMLDELPYGLFVEIEGEDIDGIRSITNQLGLNWDATVKAGYHALFERIAPKLNLDSSKLTFTALEQTNVTAADLMVTHAD